MSKKPGLNAAAWFAGQSFVHGTETVATVPEEPKARKPHVILGAMLHTLDLQPSEFSHKRMRELITELEHALIVEQYEASLMLRGVEQIERT